MVILSELVQGSSSGSHDHNNKNNKQRYDVFLSFRGSDTRLGFTAHLYDALVKADITTFLDDEDIETGENLKPEIEDAIRSSRASVIVLSKNYATSTWCLDELVLILDQHSHIVIPIFYDVEPTDVRKQLNSFGDAMRDHRRKMEEETNQDKRDRWAQKIDRWYQALTDVANLKGQDIKDRREPDFIEEIVTTIRQRLGVPLSGTLPVLLIGRNRELEEITSWLTDGSVSHSADILTVSGIGGIGKTSLAKYVFHFHSRAFHKSYFIEDISLKCTGNYNGLLDVQKQLYDVISKTNKLPVRVFLVLDDIDSLKQLDALIGNKGFHPGSKIIITTRDASLTERCVLFKSNVECKHTTLKIEGLYEYAALELLRLHAFNCSDPKEGYEELVEKLVDYCKGHPLALEVLGKSLYNRDIDYWKEYIETLKNEPHRDIRTVLQMSFDSLPFANDKELFKHIACFFVGMDREISERILKACKINTISGISNLIERCLLSIGWDSRLMMHQLLQEMGKAIVREESPDCPGKRSRLWCHDDSFKVLKRKKGTETLKGLVFDPRMLEKDKFHEPWHLKTDAFSNMDKLMILHLNYVQLSGSYENFPEELRWLRLHGFPMKSIPSDIPTEKLVVLDMSCSKIESFAACCTSCNPQQVGLSFLDSLFSFPLWSSYFVPREGGQKLIGSCTKDERSFGSLKILDLSFCEHLHTLCGFYELPALERLIVRNCIGLIEICESLEECVELVHIDLSYCVKLEKLPTAIHKLKKDCKLLLDGCNTRESILKLLVPSAISFPSWLVELSLAKCNLTNESFPMDLSCLSRLKHLCLDRNPIVSMPDCVRSLCSVEVLGMNKCKTLTSIKRPPCTLKQLNVRMVRGRIWLERISFDPDMSPIRMYVDSFKAWSCEIEGMVKIQPLEGVEQKILSTLGWTHLFDDLLIKRQVLACDYYIGELQKFQIQMYYEFGIFSTIYGGQSAMMPDWITLSSSEETPISFAIPSSPKKQLRGLNICYTARRLDDRHGFLLPMIEIRNVTKNRTWIYSHYVDGLYGGIHVGEGEYITYLSHWMLGMNEMEPCDQIIVTKLRWRNDERRRRRYIGKWYLKPIWEPEPEVPDGKWGVGFVYEAEDGGMEEEEDALEYYKSWNHIIGGDLSPFQLETGEYVLSHKEFTRWDNMFPQFFDGKYHLSHKGFTRPSNKRPPFYDGKYAQINYKENTVPFRAFCKK